MINVELPTSPLRIFTHPLVGAGGAFLAMLVPSAKDAEQWMRLAGEGLGVVIALGSGVSVILGILIRRERLRLLRAERAGAKSKAADEETES